MTRLRRPMPLAKREPLPVGSTFNGGAWAVAEFLFEGGRHLQYKVLGKGMRKAALKEYFPPNWQRVERHPRPSGNEAEELALKEFFFEGLELARSVPSHPGLLVVHDIFREEDTYGAAYEWAEGECLEHVILRRGFIPWPDLVPIAAQIGDAISHLHRSGVMHRDVTPANMLVEPSGRARLCDYETITPCPEPRSFGNRIFSNPDYAPIELLSVFPTCTPASDIYAFAASIFHAATGRRPPRSALRVASTRLPDVSSMRPGIPPRAALAIERAMGVRAKERTPSVEAFLAELLSS